MADNFTTAPDVTTGSYPYSVTTADVNGDGKQDLLVANYNSNTVSVRLGNGDGTFTSEQDVTTGSRPISVTTADVNGDGKQDLLVANLNGANTVSVRLGNGDGTFTAAQDVTTGDGPWSVTTADVNDDGQQDLLVANIESASVSVRLGNGDGTFTVAEDVATGAGSSSVTTADVNGDGRQDLLVANYYSHTVSVRLGNGDGTFTAAQDVITGNNPQSVMTADVNGDGKQDLLVANYVSSTVSVRLGNGNGTFTAAQDVTTGSNPQSLTVADVNGDGKQDLLVANLNGANTVSVRLGNGDGTFTAAQDIATGVGPASVTTADVNGDGRLDLLVANSDSNTVSVLLGEHLDAVTAITSTNNSGTTTLRPGDTLLLTLSTETPVQVSTVGGTPYLTLSNGGQAAYSGQDGQGRPRFKYVAATGQETSNLTVTGLQLNGGGLSDPGQTSFAAQQAIATGIQPTSVTTADVNSDGKQDLLVANSGANTVSVRLGNGDGTFTAAQDVTTGSAPQSVTTADVNGDGRQDLLVANLNSDTVSMRLGNGDGTFTAAPDVTTGGGPIYLTTADVNGDGKQDLLVANFVDGTVSVRLGNGDGTFTAAQDVTTGSYPYSVTTADVNDDGRQDLLVANSGANTVSVRLGNGDGTFTAAQDLVTGSNPQSLTTADVNDDGQQDVLVANSGSNTVSVRLGNGDGTFTSAQDLVTGSNPQSLTTADVNGDGKQDLLVANYGDGTVSVRLGNGDGTFTTGPDLATGRYPQSLTTADVNGDGQQDLLIAYWYSKTVSVRLGNGDGTFTAQNVTTGNNPQSLTTADVNGDGQQDLLVANIESDTVSVRLGNGDGTFTAAQDVTTGSMPQSVTTADVNGDGKQDLLVANYISNTVSVRLGNGDGTFTAAQDITTGSQPYSVTTADVNGDGRQDLLVANLNSDTVSVRLGNGDGTFTAAQDVTAGDGPYSVTTADVNGDGRLDLLVANSSSNTVSVLLNTSRPAAALDFASLPAATGANTGLGVADAPTYAIAITAPTAVPEGTAAGSAATLTYTVTRSGDISQPGSVSLSFTGNATGSHAADADYTISLGTGSYTPLIGSTGTLAFSAGQTSATLLVTSRPDSTYEAVETVQVSLTGVASGGGLISAGQSSAIGVITNDDAPIATNDSYSTNEDTPLSVSAPGVLTNDSQGGGLPLTIAPGNGPSHGTLTLNANGSFTYAPVANYNGQDSFTYTATDGTYTSDTGTVSITVNAVNDAPQTGDDSYVVQRNGVLVVTSASGVLANDTDVDGPVLTAVLASGPQHGSLTLNANGSFTYTPNAGFVGTDAFSYHASDGTLQDLATITIQVGTLPPTGLTLAASDDTGTSNTDRLTSKARVTVSGQGVAGATVQFFDDVNRNGAQDAGEDTLSTSPITVQNDGTFSGTATLTHGDGLYTIAAAQTGPGGTSPGSAPLAVTYDSTAPTVTSVAYGPNDGRLNAGDSILLVATLGEPVTVTSGANFVLRLNDGLAGTAGTAAYDPALSDSMHLVFRHTVLPGQTTTPDLAVTGYDLNGATLTDAAGNALDLSSVVTNPPGTVVVNGSSGDTPYAVTDGSATITELPGGGFDVVYASVSYTLPANVECIFLVEGAGDLYATGNSENNTLIGNSGRNVLTGGAGDDIYGINGAADTIVEAAGGGYDEAYTSENVAMADNLETLFLSGTAVYGTGNSGNNAIIGNDVDNVLDAGDGTFEFMNGLGGNDILIGGAGHDEINGGTGNDLFRFTSVADAFNGSANVGDFFYDFTPGQDKIQLNAAAFGIGTAPNPLVAGRSFINGPDVTTATPTLLYTQANGTLFYDADGTGSQGPVVLAILNGTPTLSASDISFY